MYCSVDSTYSDLVCITSTTRTITTNNISLGFGNYVKSREEEGGGEEEDDDEEERKKREKKRSRAKKEQKKVDGSDNSKYHRGGFCLFVYFVGWLAGWLVWVLVCLFLFCFLLFVCLGGGGKMSVPRLSDNKACRMSSF